MRAACVCVRSKTEQEVNISTYLQMKYYMWPQVLLVTGGHGWIIPGGKVEPMEVNNPSVSAIREAREEGGVVGKLYVCQQSLIMEQEFWFCKFAFGESR